MTSRQQGKLAERPACGKASRRKGQQVERLEGGDVRRQKGQRSEGPAGRKAGGKASKRKGQQAERPWAKRQQEERQAGGKASKRKGQQEGGPAGLKGRKVEYQLCSNVDRTEGSEADVNIKEERWLCRKIRLEASIGGRPK